MISQLTMSSVDASGATSVMRRKTLTVATVNLTLITVTFDDDEDELAAIMRPAAPTSGGNANVCACVVTARMQLLALQKTHWECISRLARLRLFNRIQAHCFWTPTADDAWLESCCDAQLKAELFDVDQFYDAVVAPHLASTESMLRRSCFCNHSACKTNYPYPTAGSKTFFVRASSGDVFTANITNTRPTNVDGMYGVAVQCSSVGGDFVSGKIFVTCLLGTTEHDPLESTCRREFG